MFMPSAAALYIARFVLPTLRRVFEILAPSGRSAMAV
jgi:hypothetical protein